MTTANQIATDPRVQRAWGQVLDATNAYAQACLDAATDPRPPMFTTRIAGAELRSSTDDYDRLELTVLVPRGRAVPPQLVRECSVSVWQDERAQL